MAKTSILTVLAGSSPFPSALLGLMGRASANISRPFGKGIDRSWRDSPKGRKKQVLANRCKAKRKHRV